MGTSRVIPVFFGGPAALHDHGFLEFDRIAVILTPQLNWKNGTRFSVTVVDKKAVIVSGVPIFLAYQKLVEKPKQKFGSDGPAYEIDQRIQAVNQLFFPASEYPPFFTLLVNLEGYRTMVRSLGREDACAILSALNELVAVGRGAKVPAWYNAAVASKTFNTRFLRDSETFFSFHNAAPILRGLEFEQLDNISLSFKLAFKLATFENSHEVHFGFDVVKSLASRISVVIGKNGVGKSQTLFHFAKSLIGGSKFLTDSAGMRPHVNRLIAVTSPGETKNTFPTVTWASRIEYRRLHLSRSQWGKHEAGMGSTLVQLARSVESIKERDRWKMFVDSVSVIHRIEELFVKVRTIHNDAEPPVRGRPFPLTEMLEGDESARLNRWARICPRSDICRFVDGREYPLSSGQITFIRFAAQACLHIENGTVLLFDEPETHLHPNLITEFIRLLDRLLEITGSVAIVATHSVYFVREVPRSQVKVLVESKPGVVEVSPVRLRTLGADVGAISSFVFDEEPFGFLLSELCKRLVNEGESGHDTLKSLENELPAEAVMHLRNKLKTPNAT